MSIYVPSAIPRNISIDSCAFCTALALPALASAETKSFQVAIANPIQRYDAKT